MTAGYSGTPLIKKLGIKPGFSIALFNAPANYEKLLGAFPPDVTIHTALENNLDLIQFFTTERHDLAQQYPVLKSALKPNGALWISWPKKAAKMQTDLNEDIIRDIGLQHGLVDVKVIAVDEQWSGLKFVYRLKDRS